MPSFPTLAQLTGHTFENIDGNGLTHEQWMANVGSALGTSGQTVPTGGTTGQVLAKASNADFDWTFANVASLSNSTPLAGFSTGSAGSATTATRSDHVHPAAFNQEQLINSSLTPTPKCCTIDRRNATDVSAGVQSGRVWMTLCPVPGNTTITNISLAIGNAPSGWSHGWMGLLDTSGNVLALTADDTTGADVVTQTPWTLALTSPYTTGAAHSNLFFAYCIVASGMPTLKGIDSGNGPASSGAGFGLPLCLNGTASLTTPGSLPNPQVVTGPGNASVMPLMWGS